MAADADGRGVGDELEVELVPLDGLPVAASAPTAPPARPRRAGPVLVGVAIVAVCAVVAAAVLLGGHGSARVRGDGSSDRFFELSPAPDGTSPTVGVSFESSPAATTFHGAYFGDDHADDPFARVDALVLAVGGLGGAGPADASDAAGTRVAVRGTTGRVRTDDATGFTVTVLTVSEPNRQLVVVSRHLDADALVEVANALDDADTPGLRTSVRGMARIGPIVPVGSGLLPSTSTRSLVYRPSGPSSGQSTTLAFGPGGAAALRALRWWGGTPVTVDGRPGMRVEVAVGAEGPSSTLAWALEDGTVVSLASLGAVDALAALVTTVHEIDRARWDALAGASRPPTGPLGGSTPTTVTPQAVAKGRTGSIGWTVEDRGTQRCLTASTSGVVSGSCVPLAAVTGADPQPGLLAVVVPSAVLVVAPVGPEVVEASIVLADGTTVALTGSGTIGERLLFAGEIPARSDGTGRGASTARATLRLTLRDGTGRSETTFVPALVAPAPPTTRS